jgi:hypothetical protein
MHHVTTEADARHFFGERPPEDLLIRDINNNTQASYLERLDMVNSSVARLSRVLREKASDEDFKKRASALEHYTRALKKEYQEIMRASSENELHRHYLAYLNQIEFALKSQIITHPEMKKFGFKVDKPDKLIYQLLAAAENYEVAQTPRPNLLTLTRHEDFDLAQGEYPQNPFMEEMWRSCNEARPDSNHPPAWYSAMPLSEKIFFDDVMKNVQNINEFRQALPVLSSRHRTIPGVANFSRYILSTRKNNEENWTSLPTQYRSSMIASRDMRKLKGLSSTEKEGLVVKETVKNMKQILENFIMEKFTAEQLNGMTDGELMAALSQAPILFQTLISPMWILKKCKPDYAIHKYKLKAMKEFKAASFGLFLYGRDRTIEPTKLTLLSTNHPLNPARHLVGTGSSLEVDGKINRENIETIIALGEKSNQDKIKKAAADLKKLLNLKIYLWDSNQREMHLSALESIIVAGVGGLAHSSCVSGKDREGIKILYMTAMEIYYHRYGNFPQYQDTPENRKNFVDIVATLYCSMHQQLNAGQNAPGANGIKTPFIYLPKDMQMAIIKKSGKKDALTMSNRLADNNEYKKKLKGARGKLTPIQQAGCQHFFEKALSAERVQTQRINLADATSSEQGIWHAMQIMLQKKNPPDALLTSPAIAQPAAYSSSGKHANLYIFSSKIGPLGYAQTQEAGIAKAATYVLPEALQSDKIWEDLFAKIISPQQPHLTATDTFDAILQKGGFTGRLQDLTRAIKEFIPALPRTSVQKIVRGYEAASQEAVQQDGKNKWPSDPLLDLVGNQIRQLQLAKPNSPIILQEAFSEHYVRAALLYAAANKIKIQNRTPYQITLAPEEIERFKVFFSRRLDLSHAEQFDITSRSPKAPS